MNKKKLVIYIGGRIRGKNPNEVVELFKETQQYIEKECEKANIEVEVLSPVRGKHNIEKGEWKSNYTLKHVIARDEADIRRSNVHLIQTGDCVSDGTWLEFGLSYYECKIPVVMVSPKRLSGEISASWSNEKATYIGETLEDCVRWIIDYWMA